MSYIYTYIYIYIYIYIYDISHLRVKMLMWGKTKLLEYNIIEQTLKVKTSSVCCIISWFDYHNEDVAPKKIVRNLMVTFEGLI
jgi:hypothetical protein